MRLGAEHGVDDRDDVGVVALGGEGQPLLVPERAAEDPGAGHQVGHDLGVVVEGDPDATLAVGALGPGGLLVQSLLLQGDRADADVRAALQQRAGEPFVGLSSTVSSASQNARCPPVARATPALRAAPTPRCGWLTSRTCGRASA